MTPLTRAADGAAAGFRNVEHLDGGFRRPQGCHIDGQLTRDRPATVKGKTASRTKPEYWTDPELLITR
jgi:hypothetical protein